MKQEELVPMISNSSFPGDVWVGEQAAAVVKEGNIIENKLDLENTESSCDLETLDGDEEEIGKDGNKQPKLEKKKVNAGEYKTKLSSDLNGLHSIDFCETFLSDQSIDSKDERQVPEAEDDGQFEIESAGSPEESESVGSSEKSRKRRKHFNWRQVARFESPQEFNRSHMKEELDRQMIRNRVWRSSEARNENYDCKLFKKQAWKSCLRKYRVIYLNTSFAIMVLSTSHEHHHEEEAGFTTKDNYHWTVQQEEIVAQSLVTHMNSTLILEELRWFNLVNGSGNLPSLLQVGRKKKYMKLARENKGNPVGRPKSKVPSGKPRGRPKQVNQGL